MSAGAEAGAYHDHAVRKGDCITSIAAAHGHFWDVVWNDPANAELKELRKHPNLLMEGDVVHIPPIRLLTFSLATGATHRFRRKGVPATLRLRFTDFDRPRADLPYKLMVDGALNQEGTLDAAGQLEARIEPGAKRALVLLGDPPEEHEFLLGHVPPVSEIAGVQARLRNLDYAAGPAADRVTPELSAALRRFQRDWEIEETGEPDEATRQKLAEVHGC
jgi:N-acetylmuramoyl-L-alanine amidase